MLYGLQTIWWKKAARQKLDGFNARCVRKILNIKPSYYSRISNADVLAQMDATKLSSMLLERQLGYFGTLARRPLSCPVWRLVFKEDLSLQALDVPRRRGRPKPEWAHELFKLAGEMFCSHEALCACIANEKAWRKRIREFSKAKTM